MPSTLNKVLVKPAGWLALAYCGYWVALALQSVIVPAVALPLAGAPVVAWSATPWRATITNAEFTGAAGMRSFLTVLPLVLQILFLLALALFARRTRPAWLRIGLFFAGFWVVLLLLSQIAIFAYLGRGALARLLAPLIGRPPISPAKRIAWTVVSTLLLLVPARLCAGQLLAEARSDWLPKKGRFGALLALVGPVLLILALVFELGQAFRILGPRLVLYLLVPAVVCVLLALLGITWRHPGAAMRGLSAGGAIVAVAIAAALYAGLDHSPALQLWTMERHLARFGTTHYTILYDAKSYQPDQVQTFAAERERVLAAEMARLESPPSEVHLRVVLYSDFAAKKAATGTMRAYSVQGTMIHAVLAGYITELDGAADAAALLNASWGKPRSERIGQWAARWLAGQWRGRDLRQAAAQIESEVGHYTLAQLLDTSADNYLSPLVREPLGAAWLASIAEQPAPRRVRTLYERVGSLPDLAKVDESLLLRPGDAEQRWREWSQALVAQNNDPPAPRRPVDASFFYRGISFSHEGWSGAGGGYASKQAAAQLRALLDMGANAIAVVPYGFTRGGNEESVSYTGTDETDEDLTEALHVAHALGMKVMLKPQLWVGFGGFTGTLRLDDPATRAAWMRLYREFILHYARLAELEQFDLFCVGTEFESLTRYAGDWRRLIADVRRVYHGPLTYAANWGSEFESIAFWDDLDYIGVNNYYPLAKQPTQRAEDLLPGAAQLAARMEAISRKWNRPILFSEVGYPSVRGGASQPWVEDGKRGVDLAEQAAAYEVLMKVFSARPWLRGMFWWKWPSNGRGGGPSDPSFTPIGKPAADVLRTWYTRLANQPASAKPSRP